MHKECLGGIAGSWILGLGIYAYFQSLFQVCAFIHKGVALSVSMSHDRNSCVVHTISDNGVVVFPHSIVDYNGVSKMVVYGLDSQQKYHTYVYSLPGTCESAEGYCPDVANSCYPNPATNFVRLPYSLKKGSSDVLRVFDNNGALVEERYVGGDFGEILLDVSDYPSGVYFYECNGDTNRFIKQ